MYEKKNCTLIKKKACMRMFAIMKNKYSSLIWMSGKLGQIARGEFAMHRSTRNSNMCFYYHNYSSSHAIIFLVTPGDSPLKIFRFILTISEACNCFFFLIIYHLYHFPCPIQLVSSCLQIGCL